MRQGTPQNNEYQLSSPKDVDVEREPHQDEQDEQQPTSFFSYANIKVAQVNIFAGTLNGYSIGFVGVYSTLYDFSTDCSLYTQPRSCETLSNAKCSWQTDATGDFCGWRDTVTCQRTYFNVAQCNANSACDWSYGDNECRNPTGYSSTYSGIFAGSMILGCMIGSMFAGIVSKRLGPKVSFLIVGLVGVVSSVMYHISAAVDEFWVLCAGRLLIGVVLGLVCVAAPMYVAENAAPNYSKMIGVLFQVFTTLGIFVAAAVGLGVGQSIGYDSNSNQNLMARMQALCAFSTFFSVLVVLLGFFLDGVLNKNDFHYASNVAQRQKEEEEAGVEQEEQYTFLQMTGPLLMGIIVAGTLQLTGINAVMNYAPTIMGNLGLAPLVGNFVVMTWNFVTTLVSIPLASVFSMRQLFLAGSLVTSVCCLFLCGIPVYPNVASDSVRNGVAITGILIFIAGFEFGVGPCFYVLAQDLFPRSFRPKGSSFTMMVQFIFNIIINVFYPIATKNISGGASGDQNKGQAIAFIFFGGVGLICFVFQLFFLFPWEDNKDNTDNAQPKQDAEPVEEDGARTALKSEEDPQLGQEVSVASQGH